MTQTFFRASGLNSCQWTRPAQTTFTFNAKSSYAFASKDLRLPNSVVENLGGRSESLQKMVRDFNSKHDVSVVARMTGTGDRSQTPPTSSRSGRTICQPTFTAPQLPVNPAATATPPVETTLAEFQTKEQIG